MHDHWWWRTGWRPGRRRYAFHLTFEGQPAVQRLAAGARERLAGFPALDLVPARWLHLTTQDIGFTDAVSERDLAAITAGAQRRLAAARPAAATLGAPRAAGEGVLCWTSPDGALDPARTALRDAIGDVWGADLVPDEAGWHPHVSLAYANADADDGPVEAVLSDLGPVPVTMTAVSLIRLGRDRHVYEWETIARLPFGARQPPLDARGPGCR